MVTWAKLFFEMPLLFWNIRAEKQLVMRSRSVGQRMRTQLTATGKCFVKNSWVMQSELEL